MNQYLVKAIQKLKPTAEFSFQNNDYSTIKWDVLEGEAPSQAEIDKAIAAIKLDETNEAKAQTTARNAVLERLGITADEAALLLA
jgi:hypothetical protein